MTSEKLRSDAHAAVDAHVESGMTVGLESGATASWAVGRIGELLSSPELEVEIKRIPDALECGLLFGLARMAYVAHEEGTVIMEA